ncbi:MAG: hypothetical protein HY747_01045 [Elusimicrobia bacterium]|nr:hypothetical protein [Elusimicrobiota bacterium]
MVFIFLVQNVAAGTVPPLIHVQGKLTDSSGVNREGTYSIQASLFNVATGGSSFWEKIFSSVTATKGNFQMELENADSGLNIQDAITSNQIFLELQILSGPGVSAPESPLAPRQRLTSVAFSFAAQKADTLIAGATAHGNLAINGTAQMSGFKMTEGAESGRVLTSDVNGTGTWQSLSGPGMAKAWVAFKLVADTVVILSSFNVASVENVFVQDPERGPGPSMVDGLLRIRMTAPLEDANYAVFGIGDFGVNAGIGALQPMIVSFVDDPSAFAGGQGGSISVPILVDGIPVVSPPRTSASFYVGVIDTFCGISINFYVAIEKFLSRWG